MNESTTEIIRAWFPFCAQVCRTSEETQWAWAATRRRKWHSCDLRSTLRRCWYRDILTRPWWWLTRHRAIRRRPCMRPPPQQQQPDSPHRTTRPPRPHRPSTMPRDNPSWTSMLPSIPYTSDNCMLCISYIQNMCILYISYKTNHRVYNKHRQIICTSISLSLLRLRTIDASTVPGLFKFLRKREKKLLFWIVSSSQNANPLTVWR